MLRAVRRKKWWNGYLRRKDLNKLEHINNVILCEPFKNAMVFDGDKEFFRFGQYYVLGHINDEIERIDKDHFYRDVFLALEAVRTGKSQVFDVRRDLQEDCCYVGFYGFWLYESELMTLLKVCKEEYGTFMNYEGRY